MDGHEAQAGEFHGRDPGGSAWTAVLVLAWTVFGLGFLALAIWWNAFELVDVGPSFGRAALVALPPLVVLHVVHWAVRRRAARRAADVVHPTVPTVTGPPTSRPAAAPGSSTTPIATDRPPAAGDARATAAALEAGAIAVLGAYRSTVPATVAATRIGGLPAVPEDFEWPECRHHGEPMQFTAQIEHEGTLVSVFVCQFDPGTCASWEADSGANAAFVFSGRDLRLAEYPPSPHGDPDDPEPAWPPVTDDEYLLGLAAATTPSDEDEQLGVPDDVWFAGQYGGDPDWIQDDETPDGLRFVASIESGPLEFDFGDGGSAYVFSDGQRAAVLWQCS
ncbi:DUF1963 domain-containing protein [Curtobacterium herbarum]|uniref:DUF1963 domain-containing protein n=1 Tax=Curtobacterium herbarum TaxID=150122 RepID=UPI001C8EE302|nr:DUF1963 domain-containing protein [Curtobacterium herbarum]MBY0177278.1 DUF1963 domain-containing protein [Curtobacterium herbarum]